MTYEGLSFKRMKAEGELLHAVDVLAECGLLLDVARKNQNNDPAAVFPAATDFRNAEMQVRTKIAALVGIIQQEKGGE